MARTKIVTLPLHLQERITQRTLFNGTNDINDRCYRPSSLKILYTSHWLQSVLALYSAYCQSDDQALPPQCPIIPPSISP